MKTPKKSKSTPVVILPSPSRPKNIIASQRKPPVASRQASRKKPSDLAPRKDAALERLGVDPEELAAAPKVSDILIRCLGNKSGRVPRETILNYLASSPAPAAQNFLSCYRKLPQQDVIRLPLEAVCLKADVSPLELLGAVLMAAKNLKAQESALRAIVAHPDVVQATIDSATKGAPVLVSGKPVYDTDGSILRHSHGDHAAQRTIHEAVGFLPTKQGSNIAINLLGGGMAGKAEKGEEADEDDAFNEAFPMISNQLEEWSENRRVLTDGR